MSYELIINCYKSGQISEKQWQKHLEDEVFRKWVEKHENNSQNRLRACQS